MIIEKTFFELRDSLKISFIEWLILIEAFNKAQKTHNINK